MPRYYAALNGQETQTGGGGGGGGCSGGISFLANVQLIGNYRWMLVDG